jgi:hypothetical protein
MVRRSRYSSALPGDWILPPHGPYSRTATGEISSFETTGEAAAHAAPGAVPAAVQQPSLTAQQKKPARYSSQLPPSWAASDVSIPESIVEPVTKDNATQLPNHSRLLQREAGPPRNISTNLALSASRTMEPPPAPVDSFFPDALKKNRTAQEIAGNSLGGQNKSLDESPRSSLAPISSSTYSPHHGRDLPAVGPSISPSYSVV